MGADGGSIPSRSDLVRTQEHTFCREKIPNGWNICALGGDELSEPIVGCSRGRLYNKEAIVRFLLDRSVFGEKGHACDHIRTLKDVVGLNIVFGPQRHPTCPITRRELSDKSKFVYLGTCGCVFSMAVLKELSESSCFLCGHEFHEKDVITISSPDESTNPKTGTDKCFKTANPRPASKFSVIRHLDSISPLYRDEPGTSRSCGW